MSGKAEKPAKAAKPVSVASAVGEEGGRSSRARRPSSKVADYNEAELDAVLREADDDFGAGAKAKVAVGMQGGGRGRKPGPTKAAPAYGDVKSRDLSDVKARDLSEDQANVGSAGMNGQASVLQPNFAQHQQMQQYQMMMQQMLNQQQVQGMPGMGAPGWQ
jgi:hypothetical protein